MTIREVNACNRVNVKRFNILVNCRVQLFLFPQNVKFLNTFVTSLDDLCNFRHISFVRLIHELTIIRDNKKLIYPALCLCEGIMEPAEDAILHGAGMEFSSFVVGVVCVCIRGDREDWGFSDAYGPSARNFGMCNGLMAQRFHLPSIYSLVNHFNIVTVVRFIRCHFLVCSFV